MTEQTIINADCMDAMAEMDANSVHAVVTDPPYGLAFMGRDWDDFEPKEYQEWCEEWATEALRVLKPGGHLIAFSGNRTEHRLKTGVEDAGFVIRDTITYLYGTGFPKGSDMGKYIDRYYDAEDEREVVGEKRAGITRGGRSDEEVFHSSLDEEDKHIPVTAPATSEAEKWDGWRTQLKPAVEFAVLARAPMSESAVYRNVLEHGTGALNIDRTRIPTDEGLNGGAYTGNSSNEYWGGGPLENDSSNEFEQPDGRYPANLLLGHSPDCEPSGCVEGCAARMLDSQSGECGGNTGAPWESASGDVYGEYDDRDETPSYDDEGGASRFFYTAKSSKSERTIDGQVENEHPTVKPLDLMEYLVTLVTAPGQTVLDPFAGSGTTIMACRRLDREGIGIEQDEDHAELARKRVDLAHELETDRVDATDTDGSDDQPDDSPTTLESFGDD